MTHLSFKPYLAGLALITVSFASTAALANNGQFANTTMAGAQMQHTAPINDGLFEVPLNKNELVRLPAPASAVIIADPSIADVSVHSSNTLLVIGRGYGETNLIVLDEAGNTMMNADIVVGGSRSNGQVRLIKVGEGRETYSCRPECNPAPMLGDQPEFLDSFSNSNDPITNTVASGPTSGLGGNLGGQIISGPNSQR